jgi:TIR domain
MDDREFHVALSFAGEDRHYVERVADALRSNGVRVFYDDYESVRLWGKNLYDHLQSVYYSRAHYAVLFISAAYARKVWTNHERAAIQARALEQAKEYVLPARFDDTALPGLNPTISYVDLRSVTATQLAELVVQKLHQSGVFGLADKAPEEEGRTPAPTSAQKRVAFLKEVLRFARAFSGRWMNAKEALTFAEEFIQTYEPADFEVYREAFGFAQDEMGKAGEDADEFARDVLQWDDHDDLELFQRAFEFGYAPLLASRAKAESFARRVVEQYYLGDWDAFEEAYELGKDELSMGHGDAVEFAFDQLEAEEG